MRNLWLGLTLVFLTAFISPDRSRDIEPLERRTEITVLDEVVATVDPRFVSFAIDTGQVVGGPFWSPSGEVEIGFGTLRREPFDFERPALRALAEPLAPAFLRIGGSEADRTYYDLSDTPGEAPSGYEEVLTRAQWDGVGRFARDLDLDLMFTLNAGTGPRTKDGAWDATQAEALIAYTRQKDYPVKVWELGNEVHAFAVMLGLDAYRSVGGYLEDIAGARHVVDRLDPGAKLAAPASAFWPVIGEPLAMLPDLLEAGAGRFLDLVTWHYYPMQSSRCPIATRRASADLNVRPDALAEVDRWAGHVEAQRDAYAPGLPVWLGETGNAQCGGAPGISDRFGGTFWWMDQLGRLARRGQQVVVRQTLVGSNYGLLDEQTLAPRPDYWATVLFKRLMGTKVVGLRTSTVPAKLNVYAHCHPEGGVTLLALNLHTSRPATLAVGSGAVERWRLTAAGLDAAEVRLNGRVLGGASDLASLAGERTAPVGGEIEVAPGSIEFVVLPDAAPSACACASD